MRVIYGYMHHAQKPFVTIYQKLQRVGDSTSTLKAISVLGEREVTERESSDIVDKIKFNNRVYSYSSVEALVDDDLRFLVCTPQDVQNNLSIYEQSCKC